MKLVALFLLLALGGLTACAQKTESADLLNEANAMDVMADKIDSAADSLDGEAGSTEKDQGAVNAEMIGE